MTRFKNQSTFCLFVINSRNSFVIVFFIHIFTIYGKGPILASNFTLTTVKTLNRDTHMYIACQVFNHAFVLETENSWSVIINYGDSRLRIKSG